MQLLSDSFQDDRRRGRALDRKVAGGVRSGIDVENVFSIDHGALRVEPLLQPGWRRACLSYGPFERRPGLAFAVFMLNGHNTAQAEPVQESFRARLRQWLQGSHSVSVRKRIVRCVAMGRIRRVIRQARWWWRIMDGRTVQRLDENLAVGWFDSAVADPSQDQGSMFMMHATGANNGELWIRASGGTVPVATSVQNLQIYFIVVLREEDAVYYTASVDNTNGFSAYPDMRPLGIDPQTRGTSVWAHIQQSVLGQIGFRIDTRIYGVRVGTLDHFHGRFGGAHAADRFVGQGSIDGTSDECGNRWSVLHGILMRTETGAVAATNDAVSAILELRSPAGLVRLKVAPDGMDVPFSVSLLWRYEDTANLWEIVLMRAEIELAAVVAGVRTVIARERCEPLAAYDLQVVDDGHSIVAVMSGRRLFGTLVTDARGSSGRGVGLRAKGTARIGQFEAHPRSLDLPAELDAGRPWKRFGAATEIFDDFSGRAGDLDGTPTVTGGQKWRKVMGSGRFERTGTGAVRIVATRQAPCPERTIYTVDWKEPSFTDVEVTITPPGTARGERENGRAGIVLWQDRDHYLIVNTWLSDAYAGASLSCFFTIGGWEDLYDAVWSNVGARIRHGVPYRLRVVCDGERYTVLADDEPVMHRAFSDVYPDFHQLRINAIGLVANWEWGLDTGSTFEQFHGRR